jgi:hypothetical protein
MEALIVWRKVEDGKAWEKSQPAAVLPWQESSRKRRVEGASVTGI